MLYNFILLKLLQGGRERFFAPSQMDANKIFILYCRLRYSAFATKNTLCRGIIFLNSTVEKGHKTLLALYFLPAASESRLLKCYALSAQAWNKGAEPPLE